MNYVGKPLAYVLATPERPDDADNPLRLAFGNEASDRDIEEFARRFGCTSWTASARPRTPSSSPGPRTRPRGSIGQGSTGSRLRPRDVDRVRGRRVRRRRRAGQRRRGDRRAGEHPGRRLFAGYYNDPDADAERMRHGMYWSGRPRLPRRRRLDLLRRPHRRLDAGRRREPRRRTDRANPDTPSRRQPGRGVRRSRRARRRPGDGRDRPARRATLDPGGFEEFLAAQADLSAEGAGRATSGSPTTCPRTATNKVLKRELITQGTTAGDGVLWVREERGTAYSVD